jgi:hypothetical protein
MFFTWGKKFPTKVISIAVAIFLFPSMLSYSFGAEKLGMHGNDEADLWAEIADIRFEAAKGHDLQSNIRKETAYRARGYDPVTPGDELEMAGDEKYLASEDYQTATKHWEKAARGFKTLVELDKARSAKENAATAWEAAKRTLREAIQIHRMAQEYYEATNNLEKKTVVLGKIARNLERLMEMKIRPIVPVSSIYQPYHSGLSQTHVSSPGNNLATIATMSLPNH